MRKSEFIQPSEIKKRIGDNVEDGVWLSKEDKLLIESLKKELVELKAEHKKFAKNKNGLSAEDKDKWRKNSQRTNEVYIAIKDLRFKNVIEAGRG